MSVALTGLLTAAASHDAATAVLGLGLLGSAGVGAALVWPPALGAGLVASGGAYAMLLAIDEPPLDSHAVGVAVALLVVGELVGWSRELGTATRDEPGNAWRRPIWIAGIAVAALGLTWALLAVADLARVEGLGAEVVGAVAALAALVLVRRSASGEARA